MYRCDIEQYTYPYLITRLLAEVVTSYTDEDCGARRDVQQKKGLQVASWRKSEEATQLRKRRTTRTSEEKVPHNPETQPR